MVSKKMIQAEIEAELLRQVREKLGCHEITAVAIFRDDSGHPDLPNWRVGSWTRGVNSVPLIAHETALTMQREVRLVD